MKKSILIFALMLIGSASLFAFFDNMQPSLRVRAMGGVCATQSDEAWGVFYNPAGLAFSRNEAVFSYENVYQLPGATSNAAAANYRLGDKGVLAVGFQRFSVEAGDECLSAEQDIAVAYSRKIIVDVHSSISVGGTFHYYHMDYGDYEDVYGSGNTWGIDVGARAVLHRRTVLGFRVTNLNNPSLGELHSYDLPRRLQVGISYQPYSAVLTSFALEKKLDVMGSSQTTVHAGFEVETDWAILRAGLQSEPSLYGLGFAIPIHYKERALIFEYAFTSHPVLDATHQVGLKLQY